MIAQSDFPLIEMHRTQARCVGLYCGVEAPLLFSSLEDEFDAACSRVALIDRSWVGKIALHGTDSLDLLHRLSTNDLLRAEAGDTVPTVLLTEKGRIIDYVHVLVARSSPFLLVSPTNEDRLERWIEKYTIMEDVRTERQTSNFSLLTLVGPLALAAAEMIFQCSLRRSKVTDIHLPFADVRILSRQEFSTSLVDILIDAQDATAVWNYIMRHREETGLQPMGSRAYEAFRVSRGLPAVGAELSENFNPFEVGLHDAISFTKGCYIGQEVIARLDTYQKVQREPWGLVLDADGPLPLSGAVVLHDEEEIGVVTSVSEAVIRGKRLAIAILKKNRVCADDPVRVMGPGGRSHAVCKPFPVLV